MQSKVIALLAAEGSPEATLLVRRGDGQFALARIDARMAAAARLAARLCTAPCRPRSTGGCRQEIDFSDSWVTPEAPRFKLPPPARGAFFFTRVNSSSRNAYSIAISR